MPKRRKYYCEQLYYDSGWNKTVLSHVSDVFMAREAKRAGKSRDAYAKRWQLVPYRLKTDIYVKLSSACWWWWPCRSKNRQPMSVRGRVTWRYFDQSPPSLQAHSPFGYVINDMSMEANSLYSLNNTWWAKELIHLHILTLNERHCCLHQRTKDQYRKA